MDRSLPCRRRGKRSKQITSSVAAMRSRRHGSSELYESPGVLPCQSVRVVKQLRVRREDSAIIPRRCEGTPGRRFRWTSNSEIAAGVTPGMRAARPTVSGRASCRRWRTSMDSPRTWRVVDVFRQACFFVPALAFDFVLLPVDITGVLGLHFQLQLHLLGQPLVGVRRDHPFRRAHLLDRRQRGV